MTASVRIRSRACVGIDEMSSGKDRSNDSLRTVGPVPLTFFAHQVPVLPLARRWSNQLDPVALVIGSMAPDFSFAFQDLPVDISAHRFPVMFIWGVPVTLLVSWLVVRVLAPVVPDHLPDFGPWRWRDYRGLAAHRFRAGPSLAGAVVGVVAHVGLDEFTHHWGWPARNMAWYRTPIFGWSVGGIEPTPYRVLQYAGHIGLTIWCLHMLADRGRARWLESSAARVPISKVTRATHMTLWVPALAGAMGTLWLSIQGDASNAPLIISTTAGAFVGLVSGSIAARCATNMRR
jgi:Domain of unknown function (DUF4184)